MFSFIISAKNEESYILGCLKSIYDQKTGFEFEVIVVDNNSTDQTVLLTKNGFPSVRIVTENEAGTSAARQKGFQEAAGEILIFLDADVRLPDKFWLERLSQKFSVAPKAVAISTHYRYYDMSKWYRVWQTVGTFGFVYPWVFLTNNILRHSSHMIGGMMAIKKSALEKCGGFDSSANFFGDETLIAARLYKFGKIIVSPSVWVFTSGRRHNKQGMFKTVVQYLWHYFWVLLTKKAFQGHNYREIR